MDKTIEQQAREMLAEEYERDSDGGSEIATRIRSGVVMWWSDEVALRAIARALTRPAPSEDEVEAAANRIALRCHGHSLSELEGMGKGGRAEDCRIVARAALGVG